MIYVTHDQIEALTLADRIAVMKDGVIQQLGTPHEIYQRPANRFVARFVGSPAMNFIAGRLRHDGGVPTFAADGFDLPLPAMPSPAAPREGARSSSASGPSMSRSRPAATRAADRDGRADGQRPAGLGRLGGAPLSLRLPAETAPRAGDRVAVAIPPAKVNLFDRAPDGASEVRRREKPGMKPIDGLSFQLYSARTLEPLERQFEMLAGLGYRRVEPFGGLLDDPAAPQARCSTSTA